ncbi:unnamed protein product, partial [Rotaria sordida]
YTIDSTQTALTNETIFQDDTRAASPDDDDLSFEMVINDQCTNEVVIRNESIKRKRDKLKRTRKRIFTHSFKHRRRSIITQKPLPLYPYQDTPNDLYSNSFEELCGWLFSILHTGFVVSMQDIAEQYENILTRRQEKFTSNMLRTSSLRYRITDKFGDIIHFEKLRNEIFRHERSKQLLTITNRLGHTPSYNTIVRLHNEVACNARKKGDPFAVLQSNQKNLIYSHDFTIKVADNFDLNPDTLYGNNSIHILNQIIVSTPENDEIPFIVADVLRDVLNQISKLDYFFERLSCAFSVTRSRRRFSSKFKTLIDLFVSSSLDIALDQLIECTINKYGKGKGGINGLFNEETINNWTSSFAFRALAASTLHEICSIETDDNSIDAHVECSPNRLLLDDNDLSIIIRKLRSENLFTMVHVECRRLQSGLVIHNDIISNITSLHERGEQALSLFTRERLIEQQVPVDAPLKKKIFLKLSQADSYVPISSHTNKSSSSISSNIKDYNTLVKFADDEIRRIIIIGEQRQLTPMSDFFAHEYAPVALSLCDSSNVYLLNQQNKPKITDFLYKICPSSFYSSCPVSTAGSAIVIDGASLLETKPEFRFQTIREYAIQLLRNNINNLFKTHSRVDVVFDSSESKEIKNFIKRYENYTDKSSYKLKPDDKLEYSFTKFIRTNQGALATCIKECWMEPEVIKFLPEARLLIISGPDEIAVTLQYGSLPISEHILESTQIESDTRMILHTNAISIDEQHNTVIIQSSNTDVVLLAIGFSMSIILDHLVVKSFNTYTKKTTYIDVKSIASELRSRSIDPYVLLENFFQYYFDNPMNYSAIMKLSSNPPPQDAIDSAEELLINCYSFDYKVKSLDELRAKMASIWVKDRNRKSISGSLPPSTMAFHEHCLRSSRRVKIWFDALEPFPITPALFGNGYDYSSTTNKFKIKWSALNDHPNEYRLQTCGECKGGCTRCNCYKNNLSCTVFCRCHQDLCCNRTSYNSSIQQVKIKSNKFELTPSSIQQVKINSNKFELTPSSIAKFVD